MISLLLGDFMKFNLSKKPVVLVFVAAVIGGLLLTFQNCSPRTSAFAVTGEIGENSEYETPTDRVLKVSPETDILANEQPVKVLLVVDNSGTMQASQQNLARSVSQLSNLLQDFDAEVMVVNTTCTGCLETIPREIVTTAETKTTTTGRRFVPNFRKFVISKSFTSQEKTTVLSQLSAHITAQGTGGSTIEQPLQSIAFALHHEDFFKVGDNALIYVITDENDDQSERSAIGVFEKSNVKIETLPRVEDVPYSSVPGYTYTRRWYIGRWSVYAGESCGQDDQGNPINCGPSYTSESRDYNTLSECQNDAGREFGGNCNEATHSPREALSGRTLAEVCAEARSSYPTQITSCTATTISVGGPRTIPAKVLSDVKTYFVDKDKHGSLLVGIKEKLNSLFGSNYLVAAQVNIEGQNCALSAGQSMDKAFERFANILPPGRLFRSSICEESAVSGDVLRAITTKFTENIKNSYSVPLDESERILSVFAIKGEIKTELVENVGFRFSNNVLSLVGLNPTDYDNLEIEIGKKLNWGK